jgi:hypothetical protein
VSLPLVGGTRRFHTYERRVESGQWWRSDMVGKVWVVPDPNIGCLGTLGHPSLSAGARRLQKPGRFLGFSWLDDYFTKCISLSFGATFFNSSG